MYSQNVTEAAARLHYTMLGVAIVGVRACEIIGESAVAMARRVSSWRVGDTQPPSPTRSELVRWTADQVRESIRSAAEQAPGMPVTLPHRPSTRLLAECGIKGARGGRLRYQTITELTPHQAREHAVANLGPGGAGLQITSQTKRGNTYEQTGS